VNLLDGLVKDIVTKSEFSVTAVVSSSSSSNVREKLLLASSIIVSASIQ